MSLSQDTLLDELELSTRTANCFRNEGFVTVRDVLAVSEAQLLRAPNFGRKSLKEWKQIVGLVSTAITGPENRAEKLESECAELRRLSGRLNDRIVALERRAAHPPTARDVEERQSVAAWLNLIASRYQAQGLMDLTTAFQRAAALVLRPSA